MLKSSRFWIIMALEVIALEIGVYTYVALLYRDSLNVLFLTGLLCFSAAVIGMVVTRAQAQAISLAILVLGIIALGLGIYLRIAVDYHERAFTILGLGILGLIGGSFGIILPRSIVATLVGTLALGAVALALGVYFLSVLGYHGRAYMVLGTGTLCLLGSLAGIIVTQCRAHVAGR